MITFPIERLETGESSISAEFLEVFTEIAENLRRSRRCVVVTGAGISVSGGIPDFRSSDGLYNLVKERYPQAVVKGKELFDASLFRDPLQTQIFYTFIGELRDLISRAQVTPTHTFLKRLDDQGKLLRCYTQNIDCLESRLALSSDINDKSARVVQLHGDLDTVVCTICHTSDKFTEQYLNIFKEGLPPVCPNCETNQAIRIAEGKRSIRIGTLRPNIVLYNEFHSKGEKIAHITTGDIRKKPDLLIVMGTSLKVHGIKRLVKDLANTVHERKNGKVIFINRTEIGRGEWDGIFDYHIKADSDVAVEHLEAELHRVQKLYDLKAEKLLSRKKSSSSVSTSSAKSMKSDCEIIIVDPEPSSSLETPPVAQMQQNVLNSTPVRKLASKRQASVFNSPSPTKSVNSTLEAHGFTTQKKSTANNKKLRKHNNEELSKTKLLETSDEYTLFQRPVETVPQEALKHPRVLRSTTKAIALTMEADKGNWLGSIDTKSMEKVKSGSKTPLVVRSKMIDAFCARKNNKARGAVAGTGKAVTNEPNIRNILTNHVWLDYSMSEPYKETEDDNEVMLDTSYSGYKEWENENNSQALQEVSKQLEVGMILNGTGGRENMNEDEEDGEKDQTDQIFRSPYEQTMFELLFAMIYKNTTVPKSIMNLFNLSEDIQFMVLVFEPEYGLPLPPMAISVIHILGLSIDPTSWEMYLIVFICSLIIIHVFVLNLVYTSRSLRNSEGAVWPLRTLRIFTAALVTLLYQPVVDMLFFGLACDFTNNGLLARLPSTSPTIPSCLDPFQIPLTLISVISLAWFLPLMIALGTVYYDPDPSAEDAKAHGRVDFCYLIIRSIVIATNSILYPFVNFRLVVQLFGYIIVMIMVARFQPASHWAENNFRCGVFAVGAASTVINLFLVNHRDTAVNNTALWVIFSLVSVFSFAFGFFLSIMTRRTVIRDSLNRMKILNAEDNEESRENSEVLSATSGDCELRGQLKEKMKAFIRWTDMELCMRDYLKEVRHQKHIMTCDEFSKLCEFIDQASKDHPLSAGPHIHIALYLKSFYVETPLMTYHLKQAMTIVPAIDFRFLLYMLQRNVQQQRQRTNTGISMEMKVVNEFEHKKYWRSATKYHKIAAEQIVQGWQYVIKGDADLRHLPSFAREISTAIEKASTAFEILHTRFPSDAKAVTAYVQFLVDIKQDTKKAASLISGITSPMYGDNSQAVTSGFNATGDFRVDSPIDFESSKDRNRSSDSSFKDFPNIAAPMRVDNSPMKIVKWIERDQMKSLSILKRKIIISSVFLITFALFNVVVYITMHNWWLGMYQYELRASTQEYYLNNVYRDARKLLIACLNLDTEADNLSILRWSTLLASDTLYCKTIFEGTNIPTGFYTTEIEYGAYKMHFNDAIGSMNQYAALIASLGQSSDIIGSALIAALPKPFRYVLTDAEILPRIYHSLSNIDIEQQKVVVQNNNVIILICVVVTSILNVVVITQFLIPAIKKFQIRQVEIIQVFRMIPAKEIKSVILSLKDKISKISVEGDSGRDQLELSTEALNEKSQVNRLGGKGQDNPEIKTVGEQSNMRRNDVTVTLGLSLLVFWLSLFLKDAIELSLSNNYIFPIMLRQIAAMSASNDLRASLVMQHALATEIIVGNVSNLWKPKNLTRFISQDNYLETVASFESALWKSSDSGSFDSVWGESVPKLSPLTSSIPLDDSALQLNASLDTSLWEYFCYNAKKYSSKALAACAPKASVDFASTITNIRLSPLITSTSISGIYTMIQQLIESHFWILNADIGNVQWNSPSWQFIDAVTETVVRNVTIEWTEAIQSDFKRTSDFALYLSIFMFLFSAIAILIIDIVAFRLIRSLEAQIKQICDMILMIPPHALSKIKPLEALSVEMLNESNLTQTSWFINMMNCFRYIIKSVSLNRRSRSLENILSDPDVEKSEESKKSVASKFRPAESISVPEEEPQISVISPSIEKINIQSNQPLMRAQSLYDGKRLGFRAMSKSRSITNNSLTETSIKEK